MFGVKTSSFPRAAGSRLFKYAYLAVMLAVTLKIVYDGFSAYYARRIIDDEILSRRISSLEYLTVLSQQNRAIALATLETRCAERAELAAIRSLEAEKSLPVLDAYKASVQVKHAIIDYLDRAPAAMLAGIDVDRLKKGVNEAGFLTINLAGLVHPLDPAKRGGVEFKTAALALLAAMTDNFKSELARLATYAERFDAVKKEFGLGAPILEKIAVLEQRMARLNKERARLKLDEMADILARHAMWTNAISGIENESPVLDEMVFQLSRDNDSELSKPACDEFRKYYVRVNEQTPKPLDTRIFGFYRESLLAFFRSPPIAQTLFVTLFLGALGALTINVLKLSRVGWWAEQTDPLWGEVVLSPFLGALAAFGIFMLGSAGMLLTGEAKSNAGGAVALSAFFIGTLGFMSGLLYDLAFGRVRRFGVQLFGSDERRPGPSDADISLSETLRTSGYPLVAELALKTCLGKVTAPLSAFTILLPADECLARFTVAEWTELTGSVPSSKIGDWYRRHIAGVRMLSGDVLGGNAQGVMTELVMQDGSKVTVGHAIDGFKIGGALVVKQDIVWGAGVVHLLAEDVAIPPG